MSSDKIQGCTLFLGLGCLATNPCPLTNMDEIQYASKLMDEDFVLVIDKIDYCSTISPNKKNKHHPQSDESDLHPSP
jgi:hypothetical protein